MLRLPLLLATVALATLPGALAAQEAAPFTVDDVLRLEDLSDPVFAPDGARIAYVVNGPAEGDASQSDIWIAQWDGSSAQPLYPTLDRDEAMPRWSADGRVFAFIRSGAEGEAAQLWASTAGEPPRQVSTLAGGVSDYSLAPDGSFAIVLTEVGTNVVAEAPAVAPPIVITRFTAREDYRGFVDDRRTHLFRVDFTPGSEAVPVTSGDYDVGHPSLSPDGTQLAYVSRQCDPAVRLRCSDVYVMPVAGGPARRIDTFKGEDADPGMDTNAPQWSPDGRRLLWLRSGPPQETWYNPLQLVVADLASGQERQVAWIDRWVQQPEWSHDGRHILALVEQPQDTWLARIDPATDAVEYLTGGARFAYDFAEGPQGQLAVLDGDPLTPLALRSVEASPRMLSPHNRWLANRRLATTQDVSFTSDGVQIHGLLTLPAGREQDTPLPMIVRLHGGPVYQFSHEFMADHQVFAAAGYAVLAINPRGSSGRGAAFAQAQMGRWGTVDAADISAGITWAIDNGVSRPDQIGVGGWSYGGILSNYMIASDTRVKAAVAGAGMANFFGGFGVDEYARDYVLELGEPWNNVERWMQLSYPFFQSERITAPTLYLCAEKDWNVPCEGSLAMYQALQSNDVPTTLVVYPGQNHGLVVPSYLKDRMVRSIAWYDRWLRGQ
ncbi:S9 family peptidase [Alteraurantiacibacter buctensis]|uniref:Prolyl oligopeptidase family serine peptidase n=1 Tax=Alteraurantiacibacter buctensis TaxID=1503981 RepID=A0A844YYE8_9SPHN|nr:S9 family peptidase [Alteraurantiacibacter buctensis]MXO71107.1 prolyl oligopeptidase family serine peptidase [Alteraurantiacibacter buctensis]